MKPYPIKPITLAIASVFFYTQTVQAANKAEALETSTIEVVGTTPLPSIGTPINQVPSNVQTGSAKNIEQQQSLDLSEYLDNNLGSVNTTNTVANPYQADVQFRGFTASPLLGTPQGLSVYMDGVRLNEAFGDIVNWDLIPTNAIANINLIPGSNPLFGLNTLGGALAVHTKSGEQFPGIKATVYGGSWARRAFEFEGGGVNKENNLDYFVAGNIFKENGWREHSSSDVKQIFGKVGWQNDTSDLDLSMALADTAMEGTQAVPLSQLGNPKRAYTYPDSIGNQMVMLNLKGSHFLTDDKLIAGNVYYRKNKTDGFNSNAESTAQFDSFNVVSKTDQDGFGAALQITLLGDLSGHKNQFTAGTSVDLGRTDFTSDSFTASVVGNQTVNDPDPGLTSATPAFVRLKTKNDYYGLYATDTFSWTDRLHMTLSGRYNIAKVRLSGISHDETLAPADSDLSGNHRYSRFNPAIGLNYNPSQELGFYGGYNEGMRAATPVELSCADPNRPCSLPNAFSADPHLEKVVAKTWEGGVRGNLTKEISWNADAYTTTNSNDIQFISSSTPAQGFFQNVGDTRRRGLELGLNGKIERLSLVANYGFVDATYQSDFTVGSAANSSANGTGDIQVTKGNKIPGIARHTLKLRAAYDVTPSWNVGSNLVLASGQYARGDENNQDVNGKVPGYGVVNLDTHYSINNSWKLFAKINNLFDKDFQTFGVLGNNIFANGGAGANEQFRSPAAPRAGWIGVTYEFGTKKSASSTDND